MDANELFAGMKGKHSGLDEFLAKLPKENLKNAVRRIKDLTKTLYL
jgi:hypothetical protein